ncbi:hypothetical protein CEXT_760541 [Caerostris extrusa]|uniref:Uncharacterized protein n=1 Tax=Caerostris extrusa TaxID=172846 RepID=A0AAV4VRF2_CAEEX|nr:hypothetical protein CEXT_760541 [Caerostris extrusa]
MKKKQHTMLFSTAPDVGLSSGLQSSTSRPLHRSLALPEPNPPPCHRRGIRASTKVSASNTPWTMGRCLCNEASTGTSYKELFSLGV